MIKVEPPQGAAARRLPPFDGATGASLYWAAVGLGKGSVVLDIQAPAGQEELRRLAAAADVLIESFDPGVMDGLGLGYQALRALNSRLIYASVSPYGQVGPKSLWPATDLTLEAAGGRLSLQGDRDRPPLPVGYPQASFHAGARAAADIVIALNERQLSGLGQRLDTSMQAAMALTLLNYGGFPPNTGADPPGGGDDRAQTPVRRGGFLGIVPCADGHVLVTSTPQSDAQLIAALRRGVVPRLAAEGRLPAALSAIDWEACARAAAEGNLAPDSLAPMIDALRAFIATKTKVEVMVWAWQNDLHIAPFYTTRDLISDRQLRSRRYWRRLGGYVHPGPPARLSRTPLRLRPAPALGADQSRLGAWRPRPPSPLPAGERLGEAFAGLKVADFSWVAVGPLTARALADHGATVVHVESARRVDFLRTIAPFKDGEPGINRSHYFNNANTSKLGLALNLATPQGRELALRLVRWADVVLESFTPGTMERLGLDYETLSSGRPDLIMISMCLFGQTGPWRSFAGFGTHGAGLAGISAITGWPDRAPCGPIGPYTDTIAPHYSIAALAAAILERRRSGRGQYIDLSQVEAAIHFIEPLLLAETVNGRTAAPAGLDSATACPHGVYPTAGTERYVAIAVETPAQWQALRGVAPLSEFADARFDGLEGRRAARERIDAALARWTRGQDGRELEARLVNAGVPASVVQRMTDLHEDPQLAGRGFFVTLDHGEIGPMKYDGLATHFSAKRRTLHKAPPCLGEDTEYVLRELLGLSPDEIADYAAAGVLM